MACISFSKVAKSPKLKVQWAVAVTSEGKDESKKSMTRFSILKDYPGKYTMGDSITFRQSASSYMNLSSRNFLLAGL